MEGVNDAFKKAHIPLPLPTATTVTDKNRREAGEQMVMKLNGDRMKQILSQVAKDEYDLRREFPAVSYSRRQEAR